MPEKNNSDDISIPIIEQDSIVQSGSWAVYLLAIILFALEIIGLVKVPHWLWVVPILTTMGAAAINYSERRSTKYSQILFSSILVIILLAASFGAVILITRRLL